MTTCPSTDAELAELLDAMTEADQEAMMDESDIDMDQVIRQSLPLASYRRELGLANDSLANFSRVFEMANAREQARQDQDSRSARSAGTAEERLQAAFARIEAGTFVPAGAYAVGLANDPDPYAATTGGMPVGFIDAMGRCGERFHATTCNSLADPVIAETLRSQMRDLAARPLADADGQFWAGRDGSPMSLTDFAEWNLGQRIADCSLLEPGKPRRELAAPARRIKFGDPDAPADEEAWAPVSAATSRAAARAAPLQRSCHGKDSAGQLSRFSVLHGRPPMSSLRPAGSAPGTRA
jgi:hypothetical protein